MSDLDEQLHEIAATEVASKQMVPGVFAQALVDADGDEKKAIARYIARRVKQLHAEVEAEDRERKRAEKEVRKRAAEEPGRKEGEPAGAWVTLFLLSIVILLLVLYVLTT